MVESNQSQCNPKAHPIAIALSIISGLVIILVAVLTAYQFMLLSDAAFFAITAFLIGCSALGHVFEGARGITKQRL